MRRLICQLTNKSYNRFFVSLLGKMKWTADATTLSEIVRIELMRSACRQPIGPTRRSLSAAGLTATVLGRIAGRSAANLVRGGNRSTRLTGP